MRIHKKCHVLKYHILFSLIVVSSFITLVIVANVVINNNQTSSRCKHQIIATTLTASHYRHYQTLLPPKPQQLLLPSPSLPSPWSPTHLASCGYNHHHFRNNRDCQAPPLPTTVPITRMCAWSSFAEIWITRLWKAFTTTIIVVATATSALRDLLPSSLLPMSLCNKS